MEFKEVKNIIKEKSSDLKEWYLREWTEISQIKEPMSDEEIKQAINFLRKNNYPIPKDCLGDYCPGKRPACSLGTCYVAVRLCGDF